MSLFHTDPIEPNSSKDDQIKSDQRRTRDVFYIERVVLSDVDGEITFERLSDKLGVIARAD